jgi:DNA invertase Pin-like site-specific DNA recombinase
MSPPARIRCAIYTRKSSEEGLDQEFNSLDAQHEACVAYVASQRHEGWKLLRRRFDDGGVSGGTLERPALQRLLVEVEAGRVGMVVVYKIDRLTRSLADFAKLVERLEAAGCSFVSVTQAFNTSSSMGRLTLNVLLSFAQFEREVTAERIRDKIAASKKKGLWMGGLPPLGYDPHPDPNRRELVVNDADADTVRRIFELYEANGCLNVVAREADRLGLRTKRHVFKSGRVRGGVTFSRGRIYALLRNPVYLGRIRHKDKVWPGTHPPIVDEALWNQVQEKLQSASRRARGLQSPPSPSARGTTSPLSGRFRDETGDRLTPTHTQRHGRRLRYYVSNRLVSGGTDPSGWRLPAVALETAVTRIVADHLAEAAGRHAVSDGVDVAMSASAATAAERLAKRITTDGVGAAAPLIVSGCIGGGRIRITLDPAAVTRELETAPGAPHPALLEIDAPFTCRRRGVEMKIVAGESHPAPDAALVRALRNAHRWASDLRRGAPLKAIARNRDHSESYVARIIPLATLSPRIQTAIIDGTQPVALTLETLVRTRIPLGWADQERLFVFEA